MPPTRLWGIVAFTLSVHALLLAVAWRVPLDQRPARPAAMTLRLVPGAAPRPLVAAVAAPVALPVAASMQRARRVRPDAPVPPRPEPTHAAVLVATSGQAATPASPEIITGVAFGLPRIGLPGASTSRWTNPPPAQDTVPDSTPAMRLAYATRERAMRDAARAQITDAAQRTLAEASVASPGVAEGRCLLTTEADARLVCDDASLAQALAPREAALSGLLQAYRRTEPAAGGLEVISAQGRYQLAWDLRGDVVRPPGAVGPGS